VDTAAVGEDGAQWTEAMNRGERGQSGDYAVGMPHPLFLVRTPLFLVRHGETTWNRQLRLQGQVMDVPLTERGVEQAAAAARLLAGCDVVRVISSDQLRAVQTAEVIARSCEVVVEFDQALREQHLGQLEGRFTDQLVAEPVPDGHHISEVRWGEGESIRDVHHRLSGFVAKLRAAEQADPGGIVLVSHGDALRVLMAVLEGASHREVNWVPISTGEVIRRQL